MLDSDFPEGGDLFVVDVARGTAELVRHFAGPYVATLDWSPDGSSLAIGFDRSGEGGRMVVDSFDLSTGELTPLLRGRGETLGVRYSPDGTEIAYERSGDIWRMGSDGTNERPVIQEPVPPARRSGRPTDTTSRHAGSAGRSGSTTPEAASGPAPSGTQRGASTGSPRRATRIRGRTSPSRPQIPAPGRRP
jgi:Tol biopolymer transport system component